MKTCRPCQLLALFEVPPSRNLGLDSIPYLNVSIRIYAKKNDRTSCNERFIRITNLLRFDELVTKSYVAHAEQGNVRKLAEPTSSTKD